MVDKVGRKKLSAERRKLTQIGGNRCEKGFMRSVGSRPLEEVSWFVRDAWYKPWRDLALDTVSTYVSVRCVIACLSSPPMPHFVWLSESRGLP